MPPALDHTLSEVEREVEGKPGPEETPQLARRKRITPGHSLGGS